MFVFLRHFLFARSSPDPQTCTQVLRLFNQPLENVVTTGVTTATVEAMEAELKRDLLREREKTGGKVLLVSRSLAICYEKIAEYSAITARRDRRERNFHGHCDVGRSQT